MNYYCCMDFSLDWLIYIVPVLLVLMYWRLAYIHQRALQPNVHSPLEADLSQISATVIVPFCNELLHLPHLLHDLQALDIKNIDVRFVLVNDYSSDGSDVYAQEHLPQDHRFHFINNTHAPGKKSAIALALEEFSTTVFCTLDADVRLPSNWLRNMMATYRTTETAMVVGQVKMDYIDSFIGRFQYTEWLLLQGLTASSVRLKKAVMCNGANLLIERKSFDAIGGYRWHQHVASGDDTYTLLAMKQLDENVIALQENTDSAVLIQPISEWGPWIKQRLRWASKKQLGWDSDVLISGLIITGANLALLFCAICSPFVPYTTHLFFMLIGIKCIADYRTMQLVAQRRKQPVYELDLIALNMVYPLYLMVVLLVGKIYRPIWKHGIVKTD